MNATFGSGMCSGGWALLRPVESGGIRLAFSLWLISRRGPPRMTITARFQALRNCAVLWDRPRGEPSELKAEYGFQWPFISGSSRM